jgi:hypothetical protein
VAMLVINSWCMSRRPGGGRAAQAVAVFACCFHQKVMPNVLVVCSTLQVVVIDEIGTEAECSAARTIAQRGVQLVATAHGNELQNLIKNPALSDLIGGIQSVTLGGWTPAGGLNVSCPSAIHIPAQLSSQCCRFCWSWMEGNCIPVNLMKGSQCSCVSMQWGLQG